MIKMLVVNESGDNEAKCLGHFDIAKGIFDGKHYLTLCPSNDQIALSFNYVDKKKWKQDYFEFLSSALSKEEFVIVTEEPSQKSFQGFQGEILSVPDFLKKYCPTSNPKPTVVDEPEEKKEQNNPHRVTL